MDSISQLEKIRQEIQKRRGLPSCPNDIQKTEFLPGTPPKEDFADSVTEHLKRAEKKNGTPRWLPKFLHGFRRNQGAVNLSLIASAGIFRHKLVRIYQILADLRKYADFQQVEIANLSARAGQNMVELEAEVARSTGELSQSLDSLSQEIASLKSLTLKLQEANGIKKQEIDAFYLAFENRYRGGRDLIKGRIQAYVPFILNAAKITQDATALDIGCGRGEWLEVLRENRFDGHGVDLNQCMAEECLSRGLKAECGDGIAHLRKLEDSVLTVVSGFHVVEHISMAELLLLFRETLRVLKPGGVAIFETPNPEVLKVSTYTFYLDPTHRNPIPPELMMFLGDHTGFSLSHIERYQPYSEDGVFKGYGDYAGVFTK